MASLLAAILMALILLIAIGTLLKLSEQIERRRNGRVALQIELTDAIHRELGAVAAPTVEKRRGGGLMVRMTVPFNDPELVATLLNVTDRVFALHDASHTVEI